MVIDVIKWKVTTDQETKEEDDIVTISSEEDSDLEEKLRYCRCKSNKAHKNKKQLMACIGKEHNKKDFNYWTSFITELGKAVARDNTSKKKLAIAFRVGIQDIGERKISNHPYLKEEELRPKAQECHKGKLYKEAIQQARRDGPPAYTFIYEATNDIWHKYLTSYQDIVKSMMNTIERDAERDTMMVKIRIIKSLRRAFEETTSREEVARKGFNKGQNLSHFDAGEKVGKFVLKTMNKWKKERQEYEALCHDRTTMNKDKQIENPGPNSRCSHCKRIPDSRLKRCSKCKYALYCNSECQRRAWRNHRLECRLKESPTNPSWPV